MTPIHKYPCPHSSFGKLIATSRLACGLASGNCKDACLMVLRTHTQNRIYNYPYIWICANTVLNTHTRGSHHLMPYDEVKEGSSNRVKSVPRFLLYSVVKNSWGQCFEIFSFVPPNHTCWQHQRVSNVIYTSAILSWHVSLDALDHISLKCPTKMLRNKKNFARFFLHLCIDPRKWE